MILGLHNRFLPSVGLIVLLVLPLTSYLGGTVNFSVHAQTPPCDPNSEQLAKGSQGPKVVELQTDLTQLGLGDMLGKHGPDQVGIDGIFGDDTRKTVIKFQQDNGLVPDGIVGPNTWGAICSALQQIPPPVPPPVPPPEPPSGNISGPVPRNDITLETVKELPNLSAQEEEELSRNMEEIDVPPPVPPVADKNIPGPVPGTQAKEGADLSTNISAENTANSSILPNVNNSPAEGQVLPSVFRVTDVPFYQKVVDGNPGFSQQKLQIFANHFIGQHASVIAEPAVATDGKRTFYTANYLAASSINGGLNWTFFDLRATWGKYPDGSQKFCCDQDVVFDPQHKVFIWYAQAWPSKTDGENFVRIGVSNDTLQTSWHIYDIKPSSISPSLKNDWFDYPQLALSNNFLYVTTNVYRFPNPAVLSNPESVGSLILRISTNLLATSPPDLSAGIKSKLEPKPISTITPVQGADSTMFFGTHLSNNQMRIYSWRDFADSPTTSDIKIPAWTVSDRGSMSCPSPDGHDICKRADSRILNGWFRNGVMGFLWNVAQGNGYPFPHLHSVAFKVNPVSDSITVDSSPIIWSDKHGIVYGFAAPDITGLGIVAYWSGGGFFPELRAAIAGVPVIGPGTFSINFAPTSMDLLGSSTNAPAANEWGDYLRIRSCGGIGFGGYVVSGVTMLGTKEVGTGDKSDSIFPNFYIFGNQILPGFTGALPCGLRTINGTTSGNATTSALTELSSAPSSPGSEQLVCNDGTSPDVNGLCADGSQPQSQSFNATAPGVTTPEQQLVCADGTAPDVTTGLCADGSQPQSPVA